MFCRERMFKMKIRRLIAAFIAIAMIFSLGACGKTKKEVSTTTEPISVEPENGNTFTFEVVDGNGNKTQLPIMTDVEILGDALQKLGYIKGEQGPYGLYIKEVNGITADYDTDGTYWAFYINGEMSMKGVDQTEIVDGDVYSFRVEKG
ncbi:MAG: DUF4430 domain-containing protein [Clostridia bacterium]|nr:DUF4430 domain-containing protein [Clostridia bacterium]MBR3781240.1 DUF4430 domain-containing protein [Clostridia bacterium]